jgi:hypothetical protein
MPNRPTADRFHAPPERRPEFAHLSIDGLREYRATLDSEESRVSYWRRVLQARLDLVRAAGSGAAAGVEDLGDILTDGQLAGGRAALLAIVPMDDLPELPDLGGVWGREPIAGEDEYNSVLIADLTESERQLSAYRTAVHRLMANATGELIARYREQPGLCLSALPSRRPTAQAASG